MSKTTDPRFTVMSELFPFTPTRAQQTMVAIVEGAIKSYGTHGIEGTTYEKIAKHSKVSRPLVQHYFQEKAQIFDFAVKFIRVQSQKLVVEEMQKHATPEKMLQAYVASHFLWLSKFPLYGRVLILFYFHCSVDAKNKKLNTDFALVGRNRLRELIEAGKKAGQFQVQDAEQAAMLIQTLITGAMLVAGTEDLPDLKAYGETVVRDCMAHVQKK